MNSPASATSAISDTLALWLAATDRAALPGAVVETARKLLLDIAGLAIAARRQDYVSATLAAVDRGGACSALGHGGGFDAFGAALVNGTAAHGEDYDDTFEGGPVHSGTVIVPAVLAACEREGLGGERLLVGIAAGTELLCRLSLVTPKAIHKAGFHPTAVLGALAAAGGVGAALRLRPPEIAAALGIAGSMASGIIEYLADGSWTKRMHAGWAAQSGIRAALMARGGFTGPRTVFEGTHGVFKAFAPSLAPDFRQLLDGLGERWVSEAIAFKPYACGTMTQPFIDCAIELARRGVAADDIDTILCRVGEGTVHRLWEPLALKHRPPTAYAAKFGTPWCMAIGFIEGKAGLAQFTEEKVRDERVLALASRIRYVVDPDDEYPANFTGQLTATLRDGTVHEIRQGHMRGGVHAPLSTAEVEAKFIDNALHGGWSEAVANRFRDLSHSLFDSADLAAIAEFRV
ncbi:MmgE/PrpD family protein [Labrys wisconsinensis]|uniref:2-methylcitrate dehydratase PrpD n=1 Tax=Labrys wisconsinensis TaxID=425677 RepID=A0ABU0J3X9_9HYPH|nr:MmgE/PrpD family protein [Labrys wisconsinensis]MDQ0468965.1 2-methylcitrate dehydratase PrpD [Labrys wisconsinensis]